MFPLSQGANNAQVMMSADSNWVGLGNPRLWVVTF